MPSASPRTRRRLLAAGVSALAVALVVGCSSAHHRRSADRAVDRLMAERSGAVTNMDPHFTIEQTNVLRLDGLPLREEAEPFLGAAAEAERGSRVLSLEDALVVAVRHSRSYQNAKEQLYLSALSLTGARHQFRPLFSGGARANYSVDTEEEVALVPDPAQPGQYRPVLSDKLAERHRVSGSANLGAAWLLQDIGRLSAAFTTDFFRFLSGDPRTLVSSELGATLSRPLLRNAGFKADLENLAQAERDLLYALREFTRYRKEFSVQVASAYYGVLASRDSARNSHLSLESFRREAERTRALADEGRASQSDLGRLEQQVLSAETAWIGAIRAYQRALDDFKLLLGMPVETRIALDDRELAALRIEHPALAVNDALEVAFAARLDYQNARDQREDSARRTRLAADGLRAQVDLVASTAIRSQERGQGFPLPEPDRFRWNAGLNVDLPLDRLRERNAYRAALIAEERAERSLAQRKDEIELEVRESHRTLEQARRAYEISEGSVRLAERRVEEQKLLAELGRARALDQVDAQNDLARSKNERTQALVGHVLARLRFWRDMGILYIKPDGQWEALTHVQR